MKTYGIENATFVCMMYQGQAALKAGEAHCPYCNGYSIRPIPRSKGESLQSQRHEHCSPCGGTGKVRA